MLLVINAPNMAWRSWVYSLMVNTAVRWDFCWRAYWRITAVVNILQRDVQGCKWDPLCLLWSYVVMWGIKSKNYIGVPTPILLLMLNIMELCKAWHNDSLAPRVRSYLYLCHSPDPNQHKVRWYDVKTFRDQSQTSPAYPRGKGHLGNNQTCNHLLWTVTCGCMRV